MGRPSSATRSSGARYDVLEQLAAGGMGVIHRAYDRLAGRDVAYKRLHVADPSARAAMTALFQREYDTLARLSHPNIVETFDYGRDEDGPYYTMELLTGSDLTQAAPLPYRKACRVLRDVASALALVHARRLVHRDVTPANVRVTGDGRAKLIDFGALTTFGRPQQLVGTPSCMAPECLDGAALDQRTDLYSLGAVAYWLLTGKTSVRARHVSQLAEAWKEPVRAPSFLAAGVPSELDALVMSLLSLDPLARPASAAYVIDRLAAIADLEAEADERRVAYSYFAHPPLAGREEPTETLAAALERAKHGQGSVALIEASSSGMGRSALLDSAALGAQLGGFVVLRAAAERGAGRFGLANKLVDHALALYPDLRAAAGLASLLDAAPGPKATAADVAEQHAGFVESVRQILINVSRRNPLAVMVDDLHGSDAESVALLASMAQDISSHRLCLIATSLTKGAADELSGYAILKASARRLDLTALDEEQLVSLVQSVFGDVPNTRRLGQWLWAQSGGNPATCIDLTRLLISRGVIRYTSGTFTLPYTLEDHLSTDDLSEAILARLGQLPPLAHRIAEVLSLHEGALEPAHLASVLGLGVREVLLSLEELSSRGVVTQSEEQFTLTASSLRTTLNRRLAPAQKSALHESLARALLASAQRDVERHFQASEHLLLAGREEQAADLLGSLERGALTDRRAVRWVVPVEAALKVYARQGRSKEQRLALLIPLIHAGFYGVPEAQRRHIEDAIRSMSWVCGMSLARRLRPYLGGKLALLLGLVYAASRRTFTKAQHRLGTLPEMLAEFVGLVSAGVAAAVSSDDTASAIRWNAALEPLSALPPDTGGALLREFCTATVEVGMGEHRAAAQRYARLMPRLLRPVAGLDDKLRVTIYRGCLNGRAQAEIQEPGDGALRLAAELGQGDPFFAPHAECARMGYHGYRGDQAKAESHRAAAELLALRGGTAWSAETIIAKRFAITAILTRDAMGLVQAMAALDRLRVIAPKLERCRVFCEAWLMCLRGRPKEAVALYEQYIDDEQERMFYSWRFDRGCYAALLNAAGRHERAKEVCLAMLADQPDLSDLKEMRHFSLQQLALAEASLGSIERGRALMETHLEAVRASDNPLLQGEAHRDRAYIALLAEDAASFEAHLQAMADCFRVTRNPSLIQQCDALAALAVQRGLRAPASAFATDWPDLDTTTAFVPGDLSVVRRIDSGGALVARDAE